MVERMLECGLDDPLNWVGNCLPGAAKLSKRLGGELVKIGGEGSAAEFFAR
jgi:hypothetical protein